MSEASVGRYIVSVSVHDTETGETRITHHDYQREPLLLGIEGDIDLEWRSSQEYQKFLDFFGAEYNVLTYPGITAEE